MRVKRSDLLRSLLLCTSLTATPALAQTAPQPEEPAAQATVTEGEAQEIIVTGTRASLGRALDIKRETLGVVDSIAAEDMGKFPDQNVAESLQRISGVSIDRSQGEGRFITVRGFGPEFNTVLLNGRILATDNNGREFSFDILPSELIAGADVYKSSAANFQEGGIGSTVIVRTARPLDRAGFVFAGNAGGKYDSGSKNVTPTASVLLSQSNEDRTFGALLSLVYDKRDARIQRYGTGGWMTGQNLDYNKDSVVDLANVAVPRTAEHVIDESSRERIGGTLAIDWVVSDQLKLKLDGLYTQYKIDSQTNFLAYFTDPADIISATANENGTVTRFVRGNTGSLATDHVVTTNPRNARTYQVALNSEWTPSDRTTITADASYSRATNKGGGATPFFVIGARNTGLNPVWELRPDEPTPLVSNVISTTDTSQLRGHFGLQSGDNVSDQIGQFRIDGVQEFDGTLRRVRFGGLASQRTKKISDYSTPQGILCFYCGYFATLPSGLTSTFDAGSFLGSPGAPTQWLNFDYNQLVSYYNSDAAITQKGNPQAEALFRALIAANGGTFRGVINPAASGKVRENSYAAYVQSEFEGSLGDMPWSAAAGVRWVYTDLKASGASQQISSIIQLPGDATQLDYFLTPPIPVTATNNYNYLLPSATFRLNLTDELVVRVAGSRTLTRPTLTNLSLNESFTVRPPASFFSSGGNPALKPYLAWNADLGLDYFLSRTSYASIAGFYKKVDNFVSLVTRPRQILGYTFLDTRPTNAESAEIYGFEAAVQYTFDILPAPFDGLGFSANYTKVESSVAFDPSLAAQVFNVEGLSDSANVVAFYEKGPIQLRGAYNWRAKFLRRTFGAQGQPENVGAYGQYDVTASVKFTPNLTLYGEMLNVTNAKSRAYQSFEERLLTLEDTGRRITVGVRASF
ncbi:TonB-dependent receptor [Sphingomonas oleivorans]|nr:TonB-dependent receptor [Sphingomonas oleivorans]